MNAFGKRNGLGGAGQRPSFGVARPMKGGTAPKGGEQFPPVEEVPEAVPGGDPPDLRDARKRPLRAVGRHRLSVASSRDVVSLEQPQSMLELGDAEREVLDLLAAGKPRARQRALHRLVPA